MTRCAICGKPLTADKSVARGIGPICHKKEKIALKNEERRREKKARENGNLDHFMGNNEPTKYQKEQRSERWDKLGLPCNDYNCMRGSCPWASFRKCPRERVYIKKDIYPLYKKKPRICSFCGKEITNGNYHKNFYKTKLTLECQECRNRNNNTWRSIQKQKRREMVTI